MRQPVKFINTKLGPKKVAFRKHQKDVSTIPENVMNNCILFDKENEQAIVGLINLWEDLLFIRGKGSAARQLKTLLQDALSEPGSYIHRLIEATPNREAWFFRYASYPVGWRRKIIGQNLSRKAIQELAWLFQRGIYYLVLGCLRGGITAAEAERRINQQYEEALSTITLKELVKASDGVAYDNEIRNLLARLALSTGSIAGADKCLGVILQQRLKTFTGDTSVYEQDLKAVLWECAKGNHHLIREIVKMIEGDTPRPLEEQITLIVSIFRGQEHKLVRDTLLRILRKTIADLPDIHQDVSNLKSQNNENNEVPLPGNIESLKVKPLWAQSVELSEADGREAIREGFSSRGVPCDELKPREWEAIFEKHDIYRQGYEFGSKKGISISSFYGEHANAKEKEWSRIKRNIRNLANKSD